MVDKKLSEFSQITPAEISKLICLFLDQNNAIKNGVVDFSTLDALLAHKAGTETFTGNKTFSGDTVFSGNATFNQTVNANVSGSSSSCTGNSATATKATQDASGNNITDTYATKTELNGKVDLDGNNALFAHIVETYQNGSNFYRIWSDGFIEQGGTQTGSISGNNYNVDANFLKAFTNKPVLSVHYDRGQGYGYNVVHAISTTGFKFFAQSAAGNYQAASKGIVWYACGY